MTPPRNTTNADAAATAPSNVIDVPAKAAAGADVKRADVRGRYTDGNGRFRTVGAGDPIPDGWSKVDDTPLAARSTGTPGGAAIGVGVEDKAQRGPRGR